MILKRVPTQILVALGLGCGPTTGSEDGSGSISDGETIGSDDDDDDSLDSGCLSKPEEDGEAEVGPCLSEESEVDSCLDVTGCLSPPLDTGTTDDSGGFISASSDGSGDSGTTGTDGTGTGTSGSGSSSDDGSSSGTSGGTQDASPRARAWQDALRKMESGGTLPRDVLAKLRAQKGPR